MRHSMLFSMISTAGLGVCLAQTPPPAPRPAPAPRSPAPAVAPAPPHPFDLDYGSYPVLADKLERAREMAENAWGKMELYRPDHEHALQKAQQAMESLKMELYRPDHEHALHKAQQAMEGVKWPFGLLAQST